MEQKKDLLDSLSYDLLDNLNYDLLDQVELDPEDKIIYSDKLKESIREAIQKEIVNIPIGKIIESIVSSRLKKNNPTEDPIKKEVDKINLDTDEKINQLKEEQKKNIEQIKNEYAKFRNGILNTPKYTFGGFSPPPTANHSGQFLTNDGAGVFSWSLVGGGAIGSSISGATPLSVLFIDASGNLAQNNSQFNFANDPTNPQLTVDSSIYDPIEVTGPWGTTALGYKLSNTSIAAIGNKAALSFYFQNTSAAPLRNSYIYSTPTVITLGAESSDLVFSTIGAGTEYPLLRIVGASNRLTWGPGIAGLDQTLRFQGAVNFGDIIWMSASSNFVFSNISGLLAGDDLVANLGGPTTRWTNIYGQHFVGTDLTLVTPLGIASGGTGTGSYTNGQLLIGNTTTGLLTVATLTGTANQIIVTNAAGSITLTTPQNINTTATAQFIAIGLGTPGGTSQYIKTSSGTTTKCVANFTPGTRKSSGGQAGDFETESDDVYYTIQTGTSRKTFVLTDGLNLTSGRVPVAGTNGRLVDFSTLTFASSTLTVSNIAATNITGNQTFGEGINLILGTATGTQIGTATSQKLGFFSATPIIQPLATTDLGTVLSNLGLRAAGTAYPITTSGAVILTASSGGSTSGQIWNDTTQKSAAVYESGVKQMLSAVLFTQTADKAVTNTLTETSIFGTGVGTLTLPANFFVAGKTIRLTMSGIYSTVAVTGDTITIKIKYGSTVIATKATTSLLAGASALYWMASVDITCRTTGASGTVMTSGQIQYEITTAGGVALDELNNGAATATIDTTASNALDVTVTHSAANASNSVTSIISVVQVFN